VARILLGVSGGIAAYRALELARLATTSGHAVRVLMTPAATRFVGPASFEAIVGAPVLQDEFERDPLGGAYPGETRPEHDPIGHLAVAERCDAYLIAPASANTLAKLAAGVADSMVTTAFLACTAPRLVAPAMNDRMYRDPATQANVARLRERGVEVIEPEEGALASRGEYGVGRLPQPPTLLQRVEAAIAARGEGANGGPLGGRRVVVTAGGTREPLDAVRFLGNRSSGRMGLALARAAAARGARVTLIAANVALPAPAGVERVDVETAAELAAATRERAADCDLLLMAAAVADFRPVEPHAGKLARAGELELRLEPTEDVLASVAAQRRPGQVLIGFAAEHGEGAVERARAKLARKGVDAIVVNDISRSDIGFESEHNEVTIVTATDEQHVQRSSKDAVAAAVLDRAAELLGASAG
jgi:phosphopantothenoylcysteine decarboxylase/phosphopantothenate--cysteine ligase